MNQLQQLPRIHCTHCGKPAEPVFNGKLLLRGWSCQLCKYWEPAIGRERKFKKVVGTNHE
ncbi:hypothetical protein MJO52_12965 [Microbulbifer variabilis]|uniref:Uncharacterized protein n=1 Tax=Microbulbifer variabilis TaxID=266805 RepID=A0ABY4V6U5_9GAMM|nr:hypothetical protein [Microbulbifer variabilis]USD19990.1 hypothetical protein MJO52_12965 [Microbulbifer variabilis]